MLTDRIRQTFPGENPADILEMLELYGTENYERETERVQLAVLKLSGGDLNELLEMIDAAKEDYRDVLAWAEFPNQPRIGSVEIDALLPDAADEIRERDHRQYLAWLADEG